MKVKAKKNFVYEGEVHKAGEEFELVGYSFSWLTKKNFVEAVEASEPLPEDDLVVAEGLPSLEEEENKTKRGKKNV